MKPRLDIQPELFRSPKAGRREIEPRGKAADAIYRHMRDDILSLALRPGDPLNEQQLAIAYGVSRTPVREAILKLADVGLVDLFPQSGTFVSLIPAAELLEAVAIRQLLEEAVVRQAALCATPTSLAMLDAMLVAQRECADADDREGFHREDEAFHAKLAEIANMGRYWAVAQLIKLQLDRFRRLTLPVPGRMHGVIKEHEILVQTLKARDPEAAAKALKEHLVFLLDAIDELKTAHPALFL